jgi:cell wall-associated NlpC family hydrolase
MPSRVPTLLTLLASALAVAAASPADASAARYGSRTLLQGKTGGDVKKLQRYLTAAGHRLDADGDFGPRTERALRATEGELELRPNGIATRGEQRTIRRAVARPSTGGALYVEPPPVAKVTHGAKGRVTAAGFAIPPASAPRVVKNVIAAGNVIATTPYKWGGGHKNWTDTGYDCSGSVSYALHGGDLLDGALISGAFGRWQARGPGEWITVYSNDDHVYMVVAGMRFDTSSRSRTGSRWTAETRPSDGFAVTHPTGL